MTQLNLDKWQEELFFDYIAEFGPFFVLKSTKFTQVPTILLEQLYYCLEYANMGGAFTTKFEQAQGRLEQRRKEEEYLASIRQDAEKVLVALRQPLDADDSGISDTDEDEDPCNNEKQNATKRKWLDQADEEIEKLKSSLKKMRQNVLEPEPEPSTADTNTEADTDSTLTLDLVGVRDARDTNTASTLPRPKQTRRVPRKKREPRKSSALKDGIHRRRKAKRVKTTGT